jgi:hypothetical protein
MHHNVINAHDIHIPTIEHKAKERLENDGHKLGHIGYPGQMLGHDGDLGHGHGLLSCLHHSNTTM